MTFVSGFLYPIHNRNEFYYQICNTNGSIYSKEAREILCRYKIESHLRRVQRWRYEHPSEVDAETGSVTHQVRENDGYVLTLLKLEKQKPRFIDAPLVDIGEKSPFFDDYMATLGGTSSPDELRMSTQISLIGILLPQREVLSLLRKLWTRFESFTSHQDFLSDIDWRGENLTVSSFINYVGVVSCLSTLFNNGFLWKTYYLSFVRCTEDIARHVDTSGMYSLKFAAREG